MRHGAEGVHNEKEVIEIADEWIDELKEFPFRSSKYFKKFTDHLTLL